MEPRYFGSSEKRLFGIRHPPAAGRARKSGVVLCYPMGQEYFRAHRAFRQLSLRLADAGFPVLRFDYYGCGDSAGESDEGEVQQWVDDVGTAMNEIKDFCGVAGVSLVGARLGATLSALAGSRRRDVESIVLWDPIVTGKDYVREMMGLHKGWLRDVLPKPKELNDGDKNVEIVGFPLTDTLRSGLENIDLLAVQECSARRLLFVETIESLVALRWREHMKGLGVDLDYQYIPGPKVWLRGRGDQPLVPGPVLESIVSWISKVCP